MFSINQVIQLNAKLIEFYSPGEQIGVKDEGLLESALERPFVVLYGTKPYDTIYLEASALFHALVKNHAFYNANKRTAWFVVVGFFELNGLSLNMEEANAVLFTTDVATDKIPDFSCDMEDRIIAIAEELEKHVK